jgi:hypothetical protein
MGFYIKGEETIAQALNLVTALEEIIAFIIFGDALRRIKKVLKKQASRVINLKSLVLALTSFGLFTMANLINFISFFMTNEWTFYTISTLIVITMFILAQFIILYISR